MKGSEGAFTVRRMTRAEVGLALEWAAREGWNPGLHDAEPFFHTDPQGFFLGLLDDEPVGCISAVAYDDAFGFIGFYIVRPEFRGRGFGLRIWNAAVSYLGDRTIGLDGVVARQASYQKFGFQLAHRNVRYEGAGGGAVPTGIVDLAAVPFAQVEAYDAGLFPVPRPRFLRGWIAQPDSAALGVIKDRELTGYGVLRPCRSGFKIGPLFADSNAVAEDLFRALAARAEGALYLDTPEVNPAAIALAERHGMRPMFETARMYTKSAPALPHERIFGITTFELG
ncbi:MAG: family N-acetyltransferase [Candidatus Eremiobacteraeota bacterium]|jgi:ribosomal protein S18 acetylase RimI-like enzyme|nr:family N-acetyltransferase [Candidatus Eremiobacteraeota bacterium]